MRSRTGSLAPCVLPGLLVAYAAGLLLADAALVPARVGLAGGAIALALAAFARPSARAALALVAVCGASAGDFAQRLERAARERATTQGTRTVEGRVTSRDVRPGWLRLELREVAAADAADAAPSAMRVEGRLESGARVPQPGERIRARVVLEAPRTIRNPGGRDLARALAREGVGVVGRLVDPLLLVRRAEEGQPHGPSAGWIARLRSRAGTG